MRRKFFLLLILVALGIISCKTDDSDSENVLQKFSLIFDSENVLQKFSVTFDSDGGSKVKGQVIESGKTATKPENPTKDGYDFEVWVLGDSPFDFSTPIISDITLKAKWTKHTSTTLPEEQTQFFTVTFDTNGGSGIVSQKIENGKTAARPEEPYRERYNFIGWFLGDNKFDFSTPITSDITLKAKWDGQVFIVSFDSDGGTEINDQYIYKYGYAIEPTNPKKDSCIFAGWFLNDIKFDFTSTQINADITLKAKWTQIFTVTFDSNGGTITIGGTNMTDWTSQVLDGKTITKPRNNPSKENYTFIGWYNDESEFDFSSPITSDLTLKAKWEKKVAVTFDYNGAGSNFEIMVDKGSLVTSRNASWAKHKFLGWYNGDTLFDFSTPIISDITLTAKWVKLFTVKFYYADAALNVNNFTHVETKEVEEGQLITDVPNKSKQSGYTLARWMLNDTDFDFENTIITADITLKAKYYCDSITNTLRMEEGWFDSDFYNSYIYQFSPIIEVVVISHNNTALNSGETTYTLEPLSSDYYLVIPNKTGNVLGKFSPYGQQCVLSLSRIDNRITVEKIISASYQTHYSILKVERTSTVRNKYQSTVDVISIYIDVDF